MKVTKFDNELGNALHRFFNGAYGLFGMMAAAQRSRRGKTILTCAYNHRHVHASLLEMAESMRVARNLLADRTEPAPVCPTCKRPKRGKK